MPVLAAGNLRKLHTAAETPVAYHLPAGGLRLHLNPRLGQALFLHFSGHIHCIACGRLTRKSYSQGYCYPCSQSLAECDICIVRPERCHYRQGTCRQPEWGEAQCMQPHYVYLANSSGAKVGITRASQIPTRWMDQGAAQALPIFRVPSRLHAGLVEVTLAREIADKTDWRKLLKGDAPALDLPTIRDDLLQRCAAELANLEEGVERIDDAEVHSFAYPVAQYPAKIISLDLDKNPQAGGVLQGIKGQYLIFDSGVLNVRKFSGYEVEVHSV